MKRILSEMGPVHPFAPSVPALLCGIFMTPTHHVGTQTWARTQGSYKIHIIPKPSLFLVPVVAITTIVDVRKWKAAHEGTVLEKPRLGILNKPNPRVIIINNFPAPQN